MLQVIEEPDMHGATPFYSACQHGHIALVSTPSAERKTRDLLAQ